MVKNNSSQKSGFTIVELLIVIVVIGILAAITIVAYNGIQNRANNTKTIKAVDAYVTALHLYKVDNDNYPDVSSCLGVGYTGARCHSGDPSYVENGGNLNTVLLTKYLSGKIPIPDTKQLAYTTVTNLAGAFYNKNNGSYNPTGGGIGFAQVGVTTCPVVGGTRFLSSSAFQDGSGVWCRVALD